MPSASLKAMSELGTSVWIDFIDRDLLSSGDLQRYIKEYSVVGMTSNPTIFQKAFATSKLYADDIANAYRDGLDASAAFERIAVKDIQEAADVLRPVYDRTKALDGYVSLEVSPLLAHDTKGTVEEARRLHTAVSRPNLFIKVPATREGLPAIRQLISEGIPVNVTLIFSIDRYKDVLEAYIAGLEDRKKAGKPVNDVASVASFFVSRVDTLIDKLLPEGSPLAGKAAVANAKVAYAHFLEVSTSDRWKALAAAGAKVQRPLWASTSTKNPAYRDVLYVEELLGPDSVNTLPLDTIKAFADHGIVKRTIDQDVSSARETLSSLKAAGVNYDAATAQLEREGVDAFIKSFDDLLKALDEKLRAQTV